MGVFDVTTPVGTEAKSLGDDRIREFKQAVKEALTADGGVFPGPNPLTAPVYYPVVPRGLAASKAAASTNYPGRMYSESDTGHLQRVKNDGSAWEVIVKNLESAAYHAPAPSSIASAAGVVTLPETGNAFTVTGTEVVTSLTGWSAGIVTITWASNRILTYSANLAIQGALSRNVVAGDVSTFMFTGAGQVIEIGFFGALSGKEAGESFEWAGSSAPAGSLEENGASYLRTDYPRLFAKIGTNHGAADGTHFNVPDHRGKFVRGWDHGAGNDPDAATRTAPNTGAATGDNVGSVQADAFKSHHHTTADGGNNNGAGGGGAASVGTGNVSGDTGGNETRPKNVNMMKCIKY